MPVIDAAVVGSPPMGGKYPTLYVSGPSKQANRITELFTGTDVRPHVLGGTIGKDAQPRSSPRSDPVDHRN